MKQQSEKLGMREYVSIAILMVASRATEDSPSYLYKYVQNAGWMIPFLTSAVYFIPLFLIIKTISQIQDKNLFAAIEKVLGKYIGFVVCLIIFLISALVVSFDSRNYINIIRAYYFPTTPVIVLYGIFASICAYGAKRGIQHIGSVSYLIIFYVLFSLYFALFLSIKDISIQGILPIWGPGKLEMLKGSTGKLNVFSDFFIMMMLFPILKSGKDFRKGTWLAYVYTSIHISAVTLIFICFFDKALATTGYPFHEIIRYISLGSYIPNLEIFFFAIWIMGAFIRFTAFLYISSMMFGSLFKIKDFEYLIPSLAVLFLLIGNIPESPSDLIFPWKPLIQAIAGPGFAAISLLVWITALAKGEFKHAKNKNRL